MSKLNIVFNPEFWQKEMQKILLISQEYSGGRNSFTAKVMAEQVEFDNKVPIIQTDYQTAELIKYMNNIFLATKVSYMNEMFW